MIDIHWQFVFLCVMVILLPSLLALIILRWRDVVFGPPRRNRERR
jgi:hypothetical protein